MSYSKTEGETFLKVLICLAALVVAVAPKLDLSSSTLQKADQSQTDSLEVKMLFFFFLPPKRYSQWSKEKTRANGWISCCIWRLFFVVDKVKSLAFQPSSRWQMGNKHVLCSHSSTVIFFFSPL